MSMSRDLAGAAVDLFLGSVCVGCARAGPVLCLRCAESLERLPYVAWPTPRPVGLPTPFAVAPYEGAPRAAILAHKERAALALAGPLGRALALSVMAVIARAAPSRSQRVRLVPPPTSAAQVRARGHDPMLRIVKRCVQVLHAGGIEAEPRVVLTRARDVADQSGLSAAARTANLSGAFAVRSRAGRGLATCPVVVVDDVLTTGATAAEVVRALGEAGVEPIGVAVVAATRRHSGAGVSHSD